MRDDDADWTHLGQTTGATMDLSLEQLGAPGVHGQLEIVPIFTNEAGDPPAPRPMTNEPHKFTAKAKLAKFPSEATLKADFQEGDGSSYILASDRGTHIEVGSQDGTVSFSRNEKGELATAHADIIASTSEEANGKFVKLLTLFLDHLSYKAEIPVYIELIVLTDTVTERITLFFTSPPRPYKVELSRESLFTELAPVYALYREAQNSVSPYYRVLCLFKIMEGLLLSLRTDMRKRARAAGVEMERVKSLVPVHKDLPIALQKFSNKPIKDFFDNFLQKQFRDVMAHFNLKGRQPLNVSSELHAQRFADVAFLSNLCVRVLIDQHEQLLASFASKVATPPIKNF